MRYLSGPLVKVISYLNKENDDVEFIFIGSSDEFVEKINNGMEKLKKKDSFVIRFAMNTSALVLYLYSRDWSAVIDDSVSRRRKKVVVVWGLISQLKNNGDLDSSQVSKWLFTVMGAMTNFGNVILADDYDINDELLFDKRTEEENGLPRVSIENLLKNWMSVRKLN